MSTVAIFSELKNSDPGVRQARICTYLGQWSPCITKKLPRKDKGLAGEGEQSRERRKRKAKPIGFLVSCSVYLTLLITFTAGL